MHRTDLPRSSLIASYCMLMQCLGRARGALTAIQFSDDPGLSLQHLLPANIQRFVEIDLSTLSRPSEPLAVEAFSESDRVPTADDFCPIINIHTVAILYFALDSIRQVWSQFLNGSTSREALIEIGRSTSLAFLANRYGCHEVDLAVNSEEFIGNRDWDWYCEHQ